jgi:signal transduction histidine kinase
MRRGLTRRMAVASGLLTLVVVAAFVVLLLAITNLRESTELRRETREGLVAADELQRLIVDLETGLRGFVITGEERFLEPWNDARAAFPSRAKALERLVAGDPAQRGRVRQIVQAGTSYIRDYSVPLVDAVQRNDASARSVARTEEGKRRVDALRAVFDAFASTARARLAAREASASTAGRRATVASAIGIGGSIVLILLFAGYMARLIVQPIRRAALLAHRLGGGDLSARMPETGFAEIGELERSFNSMAGSLGASQGELRRLLEQQSALRRVATLVAQNRSPSEVFEAVTLEVGVLSGADLARMERYEPDGTVTGLAAWSREEGRQLAVGTTFVLEGVSIAARVRETGGPARVEGFGFAQSSGPIAQEARELGIRSSVGCPIVVGGRLWGVIAASSKGEAPFPADTESQIADFTELVATAIANAQSRAELAASRARIVAAADETRRRLERDLHDGAQQRLVSLALTLRGVASEVPPELERVRAELADVDSGLDGVLDDLREISRGIHPAILSDGGLGPAIRTLARRSPVRVVLDVGVDARLPEQIEVAAYYVVSEALTNTAKHARASSVHVDVDASNRALRLTIRDDGVGGADPARGSGLIGLKDRVEAIGGRIVVESPAGVGTSLFIELPLEKDRSPEVPAHSS